MIRISFQVKIFLILFFYENISTKNTVDEISGRGMGMSAVKTELDKLQGSVDVQSKKDEGSCFKFTIPLTNN